jgi:hypothetical protein
LAGFEKYCASDDKGHKDGICGDDLSIVVQLVCDGKFSLPKKRSTDHKIGRFTKSSRYFWHDVWW